MVFVLMRISRKVFPEKLVTLMSWDSRDFLTCLVIVGSKGIRMWSKKELSPNFGTRSKPM